MNLKTILCSVSMLIVASCGTEPTKTAVPVTPVPGNQNTGGDEASFKAKAIPIITKNCTPCHGGDAFTKNLADWKSIGAKTRVGNGTMPPPGSGPAKTITAEDKAVLTSF